MKQADIDRALGTLECLSKELHIAYDFLAYEEYAFNQAISALREKRDRMQGCEWCEDGEAIAMELDDPLCGVYVDIQDNELCVEYEGTNVVSREINYCPMCGRPLEKEEQE